MPAEKVLSELSATLAPMDAKVLTETQVWAQARVANLREFRATNSIRELGSSAFYNKMFAIAGGKTWFMKLDSIDAAGVKLVVEKHCARVAASRNSAISAKLLKAGITAAGALQFSHSRDGFNCFFEIETDAGAKRVKVETIFAGGYNIQCLHLRVLISVK